MNGMTEAELIDRAEEIEAQIEEINEEIDALEVAGEIEYAVREGFVEVEETADGEYIFFHVADECPWEMP